MLIRACMAQKQVRKGRVRLGRALLLVAGVVVAGCAQMPDAEAPRVTGDTAPDSATRPAPRLAPSLARSDLGQAVAGAVRAHPLMGAEVARISAAQADLAGIRGRFRPRVAVGVNTSLGLSGSTSGEGEAVPVITVSQLLYDAGATQARVASAEAALRQRQTEREVSAAQIALNAVDIWHEVSHQRRLLALASANVAAHEAFVEQVQARMDGGAGTESDLLSARSRLAAASTREVAVRAALDRAEAGWREVMGTPVPLRLAPPPKAPALPVGTDAARVDRSPRLRGIDAQIEAAQAVAEAVRAARWPTLSLDLVAERDLDAARTLAEAQVRPRFDLDTAGQRSAAVVQAEAEVASLRARRADAARQILRALEVQRAAARTGAARVAAAETALAANDAAASAARAQFAVGRSTLAALLDAQRDLFEAEQALALAETELARSGYQTLALTGDILDVFGILLPDVLPSGALRGPVSVAASSAGRPAP